MVQRRIGLSLLEFQAGWVERTSVIMIPGEHLWHYLAF